MELPLFKYPYDLRKLRRSFIYWVVTARTPTRVKFDRYYARLTIDQKINLKQRLWENAYLRSKLLTREMDLQCLSRAVVARTVLKGAYQVGLFD